MQYMWQWYEKRPFRARKKGDMEWGRTVFLFQQELGKSGGILGLLCFLEWENGKGSII